MLRNPVTQPQQNLADGTEMQMALKLNHAIGILLHYVNVFSQEIAAEQGWSIVLKHGGKWMQTSSNVPIFP